MNLGGRIKKEFQEGAGKLGKKVKEELRAGVGKLGEKASAVVDSIKKELTGPIFYEERPVKISEKYNRVSDFSDINVGDGLVIFADGTQKADYYLNQIGIDFDMIKNINGVLLVNNVVENGLNVSIFDFRKGKTFDFFVKKELIEFIIKEGHLKKLVHHNES